ncbi:DUF1428 domain-containing protein [Halomonas denitrificans]|nr:DUF1428 domain-containing protein [Halomonas denitrificans]
MAYIDGYVIPVPTAKKAEYLELAELSAEVFREHGALSVVENWGDDIPDGKHTSFPMAVQCKDDETVVFSWVVWPSKAARDKGLKSSMDDPRFADMGPEAMPFDGKRMIFGGFETLIER